MDSVIVVYIVITVLLIIFAICFITISRIRDKNIFIERIKDVKHERHDDKENIDDNKKPVDEEKKYEQKDSLLTHHEKYFYDILEENFGINYKVQCQVNLASIINKTEQSKYQNELFRNVDFGIFDKETLKPLLLIEINDSSHKNKNRYERDLKVREILKQSNLNLITFYTSYENKKDYVIQRVKENL